MISASWLTACTLVLYHTGEREPFAEIPFPESFCIGNVFTMMVFGLDFEDIECAFVKGQISKYEYLDLMLKFELLEFLNDFDKNI